VRIRVVRCADRDGVAAALRADRADLGLADLPVPGDLAAHPLAPPAGLVHPHRRLPPAGRDFLAFAKESAREAPGGRLR
ncbi:hypothetical protein ACFHW2_41290, partial [Actinomadura sp. LOL_016]